MLSPSDINRDEQFVSCQLIGQPIKFPKKLEALLMPFVPTLSLTLSLHLPLSFSCSINQKHLHLQLHDSRLFRVAFHHQTKKKKSRKTLDKTQWDKRLTAANAATIINKFINRTTANSSSSNGSRSCSRSRSGSKNCGIHKRLLITRSLATVSHAAPWKLKKK